MIKDKETFFKKVALLPELKGNLLSIVFALNPTINISKRDKFVENIDIYRNRLKEEDRVKIKLETKVEANDIENWIGKDLRIKSVRIKSVRGFPDSSIPFGFDLLNDEGKPQSIVILGSNGSGKSSIYNPIEYNYCKRIGEKELRTSDISLEDEDEEFKDYLSHFDNGFFKCFCEIDTVDKNFSLQSLNIPAEVRDKINPKTHFISDYDIYSNGKLNYKEGGDDSFHNLIANSLGLNELLQIEKFIKAFLTYRRATETTRINALERNNKEEIFLIGNNQKSIKEKKQILEHLEKTQKEQPINIKIQGLQKLLPYLKSTSISFQYDYKVLLQSINEFEQKYKEFSALEVKAGNISQIQFFNLGLDLLRETDDCPFCNSSKISKEEINSFVKDKLGQIQSFNKINQELTKLFNASIDRLENLFNQISLIKEKANHEINSIKTFSEFSELASSENSFIAYIESAQANEFYTKGIDLKANDDFKLDNNLSLYSYFETYKDYIISELELFIKTMSKFSDKRNEILSKIEKQITTSLQSNTLFEQIVKLKNEISTLEFHVEASNKKINSNNTEINNYREQQATFNEIKDEASIYVTYYNSLLNKEVQQAFAPIKLIVEEMLEKFIQMDNRDVDLFIEMKDDEIDTETGAVLSEIITAQIVPRDKSKEPLSVNKYFNTFRYRLFSTMVGVSIAMASRINTQINLPLVLDDIFYASDFENRATIEMFIRELFNVFEKFTPDLELQLILFTHDQLIFESAVRATESNKVKNTAFAKLFPYFNAKDKGDYKELIHRIPTYLPYQIMQTTFTKI